MKQKSPKRPSPGKAAVHVPPRELEYRWLTWGICIFLAAIVWVVFGQEGRFDFVNFDDGQYVSDNPMVTAGVTAHGVASAFGAGATDNWVPLTTISHMVDCQFYGLNAGDHHLTNVLLHMATVILLFLALVKLTTVTSSRDVICNRTALPHPGPLPLGEGESSAGGLKRQTAKSETGGTPVRREMIWRCGFVAAVFAVHPLRAESVAWVSERKDVLCGVFFMLTLWCYAGYAKEMQNADWGMQNSEGKARARQRPRVALTPSALYLLTLFFAACALMSKPVAVTLPFVLLLLDYWPLKRLGNWECRIQSGPSPRPELTGDSHSKGSPSPLPSPAGRGRISGRALDTSVKSSGSIVLTLILEKIPFLALSIAACLPTILTEKQGIAATTVVPVPLRIENAIVSYVVYIGQLIYPAQLSAFYRYPIEGLPFREVATAFLFLAAITVLVILWRRKRPYLLAGWFWYGIMMVPVVGFVQVGSQAHADRHTYLSEIGLCVMLTWLVADLCGRTRHRKMILGGTATFIVAVLIYCGNAQVSYWRNSETLWHHALECDRYDVRAYYNAGNFLYQKQDFDGAITNYEAAVEFDTNFVGGYNNLGMAYEAKGNLEKAITQYQKAIKLAPDYAVAHYDLGNILLKEGKTDEAIAEYQTALSIDPAHSELRNNADLALPDVTARRIKANYAQFHDALGSALESKGEMDEAIAQYQEALKLNPDFSEASYNLANALLKKGQVSQGVSALQQAVRDGMGDAKAHNNLGTALRRQGRVDEAIAQYQQAIKIDPGYAPAHYNLGNALLQKGDVNGAIGEYQVALKLKPDNVMVQRNIAHTIWALATSPDAAARNGTNAVEFARAANEVTSGASPLILRVLAAAYAESGDFPKATDTAKQALQLATAQQNPGLEFVLRQEISGYQRNSPVRAEPADMSGWQ